MIYVPHDYEMVCPKHQLTANISLESREKTLQAQSNQNKRTKQQLRRKMQLNYQNTQMFILKCLAKNPQLYHYKLADENDSI